MYENTNICHGSGKTTLAKPFAELIGGVYLNADEIRKEYNDWDCVEGRHRQAFRMRCLADGVVKAGKIAVADFIAPTRKALKSLMQTIQYGWTQY